MFDSEIQAFYEMLRKIRRNAVILLTKITTYSNICIPNWFHLIEQCPVGT